MTVKDFIQKYNGDIDHLNIKKYVPISEKAAAINTSLEKLIETDKLMVATYNSISVEVTRVLTALSLYTDLEAYSLEDFDMLAETGLITSLINNIGEDYYRYNYFFDERMKDVLREKNSLDGIVERLLGLVTGQLENLNPDTIAQFIKLLDKM